MADNVTALDEEEELDEAKLTAEHNAWLESIKTADLPAAVAALREWASVEPVPAQEEFDLVLARLAWLTDCSACSGDETAELVCTASQRPCRHHCNCVMVHDHCHWCGAEWGEEND